MRAQAALLLAVPFALLTAMIACSDQEAEKSTPDDETEEPERPKKSSSSSSGEDPPPDDTTDPDPPTNPDPPTDPDSGTPPPPAAATIYGHSAGVLFKYDPVANTVTEIGPFGCVPRNGAAGTKDNDSVIDLAVDSAGQLFATTFWRFIKVDPSNGSCIVVKTATAMSQYPNSLSFVPGGNGEILVGYVFDANGDATAFARIDPATGAITQLGQANPVPPLNGKNWGLSGDVFTVQGGKTYAAVKDLANTGNDQLAEVDPATGKFKAILGDTSKKQFYGVAYSGGKAYGFAANGGIHEINLTTGAATLKLDAKDKNNAAIAWFGAGAKTGP